MKRTLLLPLLLIILASACRKELVIKDVDYSQAVESVLSADERGQITDIRNGISFNVATLHALEQDSPAVNESIFRLIRDKKGYYYLTASGYRNVYVFESGEESLSLIKKIPLSDNSLSDPVLNSRPPHIQVVDMNTKQVYHINHKGILKGEKS